jgi:thymidylate synthase (FAD)
MLKSKHHLSVFEHGTVYLKVNNTIETYQQLYKDFFNNPYSKATYFNGFFYVTTNMRVIIENNLENYLIYICEPTEHHDKRITAHFNCSIGISREYNRHRSNSVSEQSTRYCNFSKEKFNNEITFVIPSTMDKKTIEYFISNPGTTAEYDWDYTDAEKETSAVALWYQAMESAESSYFDLIERGWKPQQAREVLPLSTATELIHTAFESDWNHFIELRTASGAHPDAQKLANILNNLIHNAAN